MLLIIPGAVVPSEDIPPGLVGSYRLSGDGYCCSCGSHLPTQQLAATLQQLQQAAEYMDEAAGIMAGAWEQKQQGLPFQQQQGVPLQQQQGLPLQQQAQAAMQAVNLLQRCLAIRQTYLHAHSLLLGHTHHQLAEAAVAAAGLSHVLTWSNMAAEPSMIAAQVDTEVQQYLLSAGAAAMLTVKDAQQQLELAVKQLKSSLAILEHVYPTHSTAVAFEQFQLALVLQFLKILQEDDALGRGNCSRHAPAGMHDDEIGALLNAARTVALCHSGNFG